MHPTTNRRAILTVAIHAALLCTALLIAFGPLTPPSGVVTSTAKPLSEVEPRIAINLTNTPGDADSVYRITQAGGYYLAANMLVPPGKNGIEIAASNVTIDLNGYQIAGFGGLAGIVPSSTSWQRITLRHGRVHNCTTGINLIDADTVVVEDITVDGCSDRGIVVGAGSRITGCIAADNTSTGISAGTASLIERCITRNNGGGISGSLRSRIDSCTADGNSGPGISVSDNSVVSHCSATGNATGFNVNHATVESSTAALNTGSGISLAGGRVLQCESRDNGTYGIYCFSSYSVIEGNVCHSNPTAGIYNNAGACRIVGNTCSSNGTGIKSEFGSGSFIFANICGTNTLNWFVNANNHCLVVAAADAPAFSGDSGGLSPGSTSPWTNFTR